MSTDEPSDKREMSKETFDEFRNSFSYGSRTDLLFKFLKSCTEQQADDFLRELLQLTGDLIDDGDVGPVVDAIVRAQTKSYSQPGNFVYDDKPFTPLSQPVSKSNIALLTTTGHFEEGNDPHPFGMTDLTQDQVVKMTGEFGKADPVLSEIPITTSRERTVVRHGGYDIRATAKDRNVSLPIDRMNELAADGVIGQFVDPAYSFVGLTSQLRLRKELGKEWAGRAKAVGAQAAVLIPI